MTDRAQNVKSWISAKWAEAREWLECHPVTTAYIIFFLLLNYVLDFLPPLF
jgi:hypothetical protein